jgi:hypothetical protein
MTRPPLRIWIIAGIARPTTRVAHHALALEATIRDAELSALDRQERAARALALLAHAARRLARDTGDTVTGLVARDLATAATADAIQAREHLKTSLSHVLQIVETTRSQLRNPQPLPADSFRDHFTLVGAALTHLAGRTLAPEGATQLEHATATALDLAAFALASANDADPHSATPPSPRNRPDR